MDYRAMGKVGLSGWRGKVGGKVAERVSERSRFSQDQIEALIGAVFLALAAWQFFKLARQVLQAGRREEVEA
ncbi:MAG: hypothetical protein M3N24_01030 [Actinomycetota bacterium]|nr:hypothetical protein [Actinomycetota bacterium]